MFDLLTDAPAPVSPKLTSADAYVYAYKVDPDSPLLVAGKNAAEFIAEMPANAAPLAEAAANEAAGLPDSVLLCSAVAFGQDVQLPILVLVICAAATVELAKRYRACTLHPVVASGDMPLALSWVRSPAVKAEALAAIEARKAQMEAKNLPKSAIN